MHIRQAYILARSLKYDEFESEIARIIDNVPTTVKNNNKYIIVNENNIHQQKKPKE